MNDTARIIEDGLDAYGRPKFYRAQETTPERRRQAKDAYEAPERSQTANRPYGRILSAWERLEAKGSLNDRHARAGNDLSMYWVAANTAPSTVGSYGDQRWNGTPVSQVDSSRLLGAEWRETCRRYLKQAEAVVDDDKTWKLLTHLAEHDSTMEQAGHSVCLKDKKSIRNRIRRGLDKLADYWYGRG